ncbi:PAC2 family protein [Candidatus Micrarchaeota archaeon]|nr:PAC2 family protein [Candidatus Micrarchaeota archaeon]
MKDSTNSDIDMTKSHIIIKHEIKPKDPILIVGLPGIGFVSKLACDHLIKTTKAQHFATLYSPNFPNQVIALKSGNLKLFSMRFFYKKFKGRDTIILKGDVQPLTVEGQYEVSAKILNFFKGMGGSEVVAMAGYAVNKKNEKPQIFCTSNSKSHLKYFTGLGTKQNEAIIPIVGMAGLVPAVARLFKIKGSCLLVETQGQAIDSVGASSLLDLISKIVKEKIPTEALKGKAKKTEEVIKKIEQQASREEAHMAGLPEMPKKETLTYIH